jgi:hypothetical protein
MENEVEKTTNDFVHALRLQIAEATAKARELSLVIGRGDGGREVSLTITKLQEAKMWLGKVLEVNGEPVISDEPCKNGCTAENGMACSDCPKK